MHQFASVKAVRVSTCSIRNTSYFLHRMLCFDQSLTSAPVINFL